jgi:hypothetical protein
VGARAFPRAHVAHPLFPSRPHVSRIHGMYVPLDMRVANRPGVWYMMVSAEAG